MQISLGSVSIDNRSIDMSPKLKSPMALDQTKINNKVVSTSPDQKEKFLPIRDVKYMEPKQFILNQKGIQIKK